LLFAASEQVAANVMLMLRPAFLVLMLSCIVSHGLLLSRPGGRAPSGCFGADYTPSGADTLVRASLKWPKTSRSEQTDPLRGGRGTVAHEKTRRATPGCAARARVTIASAANETRRGRNDNEARRAADNM
jgi:hypothetical protein